MLKCTFSVVRRLSSLTFHIFDFSKTTERNSTKLDRKQDLNVLYQVYVFQADLKNKRAALASDWQDIFHFSSEPAERNSRKLDRKQDLNVLYQVCVFWANRKTRWPPWPLIGWDILDFSSETANRNLTKLDRSKISMSATKFVFFRPIGKTKWPPLVSQWLRDFQLFLWNHWTEFKGSWQKARSQHLLPSLCFSGWSVNKNGHPGWSI